MNLSAKGPARFLSFAVCLLLLAGLVFPAFAAEPAAKGDASFYVEPNLSYYGIKLPAYAPIALEDLSFVQISSLTTEKGDESGLRTGLTLGWKSGLAVLGAPVTFEANLFHAQMNNSKNNVFDYSTSFRVGWYDIAGGNNGMGLGGGDDVSAKTKRDVLHMGLELLAKFAFPINADNTLTPYIGYSGMVLDQKFRTSAFEVQTPTNMMDLTEDLSVAYHGLALGARLDHRLTNELQLFTTLGGALYYAQADYHGAQLTAGPTIPEFSSSLRKRDDTLAGRLQADCGVQYTSGPWSLGAFGGVEYLSYVPKIIASNTDSTGIGTHATHLSDADSYAWKLGASFAYHF